MPSRRTILLAGLAVAALGGGAWWWRGRAMAEGVVFAPDGIAIRGYDPVAYFTERAPVKGSPEHALEHGGAVWWFASAANRDAFAADPDRYKPAYGGYCAWAVAAKDEAYPTAPEAWDIVDDRLYLNFDLNIQDQWHEDVPGFIAAAEKRWPGLQARLAASAN